MLEGNEYPSVESRWTKHTIFIRGRMGSKFKKLVKELDFQKIVDLLTDCKGKWNATRKNPHESITRGTLTELAKVCSISYVQSFYLSRTCV